MLPEKDGYAVCRELKEDEKTKNIPVLMLTSIGKKLTVPNYGEVMARNHNVDDYLEKPIETKDLIERINKHIVAL